MIVFLKVGGKGEALSRRGRRRTGESLSQH